MNTPDLFTRNKSLFERGKRLFNRNDGFLSRSKELFSLRRRRSPLERLRDPLARVGAGIATTAAALAAYRYVVQPWHKTWGATEEEAQKPLPGDEFVPDPAYMTTRAITIEAPPEDVWPWLVQVGQDRGGFYSYEWLENIFGLDIHNADEIISEWQNLEVGDIVRLGPTDRKSVV